MATFHDIPRSTGTFFQLHIISTFYNKWRKNTDNSIKLNNIKQVPYFLFPPHLLSFTPWPHKPLPSPPPPGGPPRWIFKVFSWVFCSITSKNARQRHIWHHDTTKGSSCQKMLSVQTDFKTDFQGQPFTSLKPTPESPKRSTTTRYQVSHDHLLALLRLSPNPSFTPRGFLCSPSPSTLTSLLLRAFFPARGAARSVCATGSLAFVVAAALVIVSQLSFLARLSRGAGGRGTLVPHAANLFRGLHEVCQAEKESWRLPAQGVKFAPGSGVRPLHHLPGVEVDGLHLQLAEASCVLRHLRGDDAVGDL